MLDMLSDHRRWAKGAYNAGFARYCLMGAWMKVTDCPYWRIASSYSGADECFLQHLAAVIAEQHPEQSAYLLCRDAHTMIVHFNDHPDIRYGDIRRVLEKIAAG